MKSVFKNTVLVLCALGLLAGCASKDVEYDDSAVTNVDQQMDNVAVADTDSQSSSLSKNQDSMYSTDSLQKITNSSVNNVQSDIDGKVVLLESVHFGFDKYKLSDEMREVASSNYIKIDETAQSYSGLKIKLEGNTDEWGSDEYNYALGLKRAKVVKDVLVNNGVNANVSLVTLGESNPACTSKTTACWQKNRRVEHALIK